MVKNHARLKIVSFLGVLIALSAFIALATLNEPPQTSNQLLAFYEIIPVALLTGLALTIHLLFQKNIPNREHSP